jgi:hypothetical protein
MKLNFNIDYYKITPIHYVIKCDMCHWFVIVTYSHQKKS